MAATNELRLEIPAMDEKSPHRRSIPGSGSPSRPARILDRKIERRAFPESFSSNLAWKRASPTGTGSNRSVRAMVGIFEKPTATSDNQTSNRPRVNDKKENRQGGHDSKNRDNKMLKSPHESPRNGIQQAVSKGSMPSLFLSTQVGFQVEEYSLTLLKHKSYFNNRPLARCLDGRLEEDKETKIQRVMSEEARGTGTATQETQMEKAEDGQETKKNRDIAALNRDGTSSPTRQLDNLMGELLVWQGISESSTPRKHHEWKRRDPEEVDVFWKNVRTRLWVDDNEISEEGPSLSQQADSMDGLQEENENHSLKLSSSASSFITSDPSGLVSEPPFPPMPTRAPPPPPPPISTAPRGRSYSTASSQWEQHSATSSLEPFPDSTGDYSVWDEPPPTSSVRLSISAPGFLDSANPLANEPMLPAPGRPLPAPPTQPGHSRYPSSNSSGRWTRPPTWRSPSSLQPSSPPPVPPLPMLIPTPPTSHHRRGLANHSRNRRRTQSSKASASASFSTTYSVSATDSSGSRSIHSRGTTPKTSTSSTTTRSTRAGSSADLTAIPQRPGAPFRRRLTTEEKLSEIDAFLSPELGLQGKGNWI